MEARRSALLRALRREEAVDAPPQARILEARVAAPFGGGEPVMWERLRLLPSFTSQDGFNLLVARPTQALGSPAVLLLHATGKCKELVAEHLERWAQRGFLAVAFDAPFHGERAEADVSLERLGPDLSAELLKSEPARLQIYYDNLTRGWRDGSERYVMDIARDALLVVDYLSVRPDVLSERLGVAGVSLGGMAVALLAAADVRIRSAMPAIGVQSFHHSLVNDLWQARVDSVRPVFEAAAKDLGKAEIDQEVVRAVWAQIAPGLAEADESKEAAFDMPLTLPLIAPRHLLVLSGEKDPRCPLPGLRQCIAKAQEAYDRHEAKNHMDVFIEEGVPHRMTENMWRRIDAFLEATLSAEPAKKLAKRKLSSL
ncbi:unnamed protein product [Effrenium voratum]|uniref:Dienelactone hydrolase domain-containing protein n=1 Tax=Effrenium voratum TaxID=2562239 RepID=A0AA36IVW6_9DINO|nr:unnamed protein product [Effrenium voratum]CAJ1438687.1 unnamed protein product [Effrenium voratum]